MKTKIITIVVLLILLIGSLYAYELIFKRPLLESPTGTEQPADEDLFAPSLDVKEQYVNGTYTFGGKIQVPTPCHSLNSTVVPGADGSYQIAITTVEPKAGTVCAQVLTDKTFKVSFAAPENAVITATVDGVEYDLNRFDIPAGTDFDAYQLQIKG